MVKIYFSTQCQVCRELLPGIFKTMERIKNPKFKFEFYGMPLPASKDPLAVELKITDFPTGILYVDGKEVGRAQRPQLAHARHGDQQRSARHHDRSGRPPRPARVAAAGTVSRELRR